MDMRNSKAVAPPGIRFRHSRKQKCRVCLKKTIELINIFDITPDQGVSIADLLSQSTGVEIFKGDSDPETICTQCLQDARSAFEIKQTQARSNQFIQLLKQDPEATEKESEVIYNLSEESPPQMEYFLIDEFLPDEVKPEATEELISNEEPTNEYVHGQVINEPIENDSLDEVVGEGDVDEDVEKGLDYEIDPSYLRQQSENTNDKNSNENRSVLLTLSVGPNSFAFQCSSCPRLFPTKSQMKIHEYRHKIPTYKCSYCNMAFIYQSLLQQHIRKHTGERPFKCLECQKDFSTQQQYSVHFKSHPKVPLFKCSHCGLVFKSLPELKEHITTHAKKQSFDCPVKTCNRVFHNKDALQNHIAFNHLKPSNIKCSHCQTDFSSTHELLKHIKQSHPEAAQELYECSYCEKSFKWHQSLMYHIKHKHRDIADDDPSILIPKKRKAKRKAKRKVHIKRNFDT